MKHFGIESSVDKNVITIQNQSYQTNYFNVEPDWSAASYWYEMAAFSDEADLLIKGLSRESIQGDSVLPDIFENFGVKTNFVSGGIRLTKSGSVVKEFKYDFTSCPDLAPAVIVTCAGLNIPAVFTGLETLRVKETDRLTALITELKKTGYETTLSQNLELRTQISGSSTQNVLCSGY